ncbi:exodeoxyribonuclease I [Neptuniibacter caesariensis]|uniref:Exodeoxyribonuclease I n=1 Tax=Neptuniibacter caesariensis TaxID=207954 RepID=A0A7U8GPS2_NEPCE|nr:exodeoxyribonuclease I [Neptuniibacter caesariensis]EAR59607.1 exodeoxyribonuclease I [Oceanospirillum sp. MED92] [Neptuniibacter caesariensis]
MANQPLTFYWHDYETFGADPKRDWPVQFAGIRTDEHLNVIEEPLMVYCKPSDDQLPYPEACLITGITPQKAMDEGLCEADFFAKIHEQLARPGTCGVGYNSIRFDDEVTRYGLYRNFFDPYAREWQNGCSRWDIIDMLRLTRTLRPEGIVWPKYEDGTPSLRLEDLTVANGIDHGHAHDALSDVYATIEMAKLVREKQPKLFNYVLNNRSKQSIQSLLDTQSFKPVLHISSRYAIEYGNTAVVAPIATHPVNKNGVIVWDLRFNPEPLMQLSAEELRQLLYTPRAELDDSDPRIALKQVHINKCPIIAPAGMISSEEAARLQINGDQCRAHLQMLRSYTGFREKLADIYSESPFDTDSDPDQMLYSGGFFTPSDRQLMDQVRESGPDQLAELDLPFQDPRLEEMLLRYKARNCPHVLNHEDQMQWETYRQRKLLKGEGGHLTMEKFYQRLNELYAEAETDEKRKHILEELAVYAEAIYPMDDSFDEAY